MCWAFFNPKFWFCSIIYIYIYTSWLSTSYSDHPWMVRNVRTSLDARDPIWIESMDNHGAAGVFSERMRSSCSSLSLISWCFHQLNCYELMVWRSNYMHFQMMACVYASMVHSITYNISRPTKPPLNLWQVYAITSDRKLLIIGTWINDYLHRSINMKNPQLPFLL